MKFTLKDENTDKEYSIQTTFKTTDEFFNWSDGNADFQNFMDEMECGSGPECGVHDCADDGTYIGYQSYEIQDFNLAISKWEQFFKKHGKVEA